MSEVEPKETHAAVPSSQQPESSLQTSRSSSAQSEGSPAVEDSLAPQIIQAVQDGKAEVVSELLKVQADPSFQDENGRSLLMLAASVGHRDVAALLLEHGAPWNALDKEGDSAGEYALRGGHSDIYERLLEFGCRAELLLSFATEKPKPNDDFLSTKLKFVDDTILDSNNDAVMMGWEGPLMQLHAQVLCPAPGKHVLNVGFGLGLIDSALQALQPASHTIIEAHPDIWAHMLALGWDRKPGVRMVFGRWQDVIGNLGPFDGVFFDTFGEHYEAMKEFHEHLDHLLKPDGIYSFFNGLAASTNAFFHAVYCRVAELELLQKEFSTEYISYSVDEILKEEKWRGVRRKYFVLDTYNLPIVRRADIIDCAQEEGDESTLEDATKQNAESDLVHDKPELSTGTLKRQKIDS